MFVLRRVLPIVLSVLVLSTNFLPWAHAGIAVGTEEVFGHEIPVIGWSAIVASLVLLGLSVVGAVHPSRWWWVGASFVAALMVTSAAVTLATIDVVDSAAVKWIIEVLPEAVRDSSPSISPSFGLWAMVGVLTAQLVVMAVVTVRLGASVGQKSSRNSSSNVS